MIKFLFSDDANAIKQGLKRGIDKHNIGTLQNVVKRAKTQANKQANVDDSNIGKYSCSYLDFNSWPIRMKHIFDTATH